MTRSKSTLLGSALAAAIIAGSGTIAMAQTSGSGVADPNNAPPSSAGPGMNSDNATSTVPGRSGTMDRDRGYSAGSTTTGNSPAGLPSEGGGAGSGAGGTGSSSSGSSAGSAGGTGSTGAGGTGGASGAGGGASGGGASGGGGGAGSGGGR